MNERVIFFIIIFGIAILLISVSVALYLMFNKEKIINEYDCYVFSIFWTPTTCTTKKTGNYECFQKVKELKDDKYFTIHGLWPSLLSGVIPESCNSGKNIIPDFTDDKNFEEKMGKYWPGLYSNNTYLWTNEYNKHGYCYIKRSHLNVIDDYKIYFNKTVNMFEDGYRDLMEKILPDSKGIYNVSKIKFKNLLNNSMHLSDPSTYALICEKNEKDIENKKYLSEIRFIYDLNFKRISPEKSQENCPDYFLLNFTDDEKTPVYQKYDIYIYSLSYGPSICKFKGKQCYNILKSKEFNRFTIHGLWPSYKNGIIPQMCNIGEDIEIKYNNESDYFTHLEKYWYSLYNTNSYFWTHEYNTHGLCYNKRLGASETDYQVYLNKTLDIYINNFVDLFNYVYNGFLPREQKVNKTYLLSKLKEKCQVNNSYYITCKKNENGYYYLDEIKFKFDMNFGFTSEGTNVDNCPEEFYLEILDGPKAKYKTHEGVWNTYDDYVFSIFFQTTTCKNYGYHCYNAIENFPKNIWTIHGLWPNYKNGTIPGWCNGENDIDIEIKNQTLYEDMKKYYPGLFSTNERFWGHEYNKHGYCYNQRNEIDVNDYEKFFLKVFEIYNKYDLGNIFINMFDNKLVKGDVKINRSELEKYFEKIGIEKGDYLLICDDVLVDNKNVSYIGEIRIRLDLDFVLYKNETDKTNKDCPSEFMVEFL